jgi:hypothetical protein
MRYATLIVLSCLLSSCAMRVIVKECEPVVCKDCDEPKEWVCTARR